MQQHVHTISFFRSKIFATMVLRNIAQPTMMVQSSTSRTTTSSSILLLPFDSNDLLNITPTNNNGTTVTPTGSSCNNSGNFFLTRLSSSPQDDDSQPAQQQPPPEALLALSSPQQRLRTKVQSFLPTKVRRAFKANNARLHLLVTAATTGTETCSSSSSDKIDDDHAALSWSHGTEGHHSHGKTTIRTPAQQGQEQRRTVQFDFNRTSVHTYDRPILDNSEMWWTANEILESRAEARASIERSQSAQAYLLAYQRANQQVCREKRLSGAYLADLTHGLIQGHRGLELFTRAYHATRRREINAIVRSVVTAHKKATGAASATKTAAGTTARGGRDHAARQVRAHSSALTQNSRHWAHALGRADRNAIQSGTAVSDSRCSC